MAVHHPGLKQSAGDLMFQIRQLVAQAMQNASFGSAGLRVYGGGWIRIENGGLDVTGTANVTGELGGSGTFDWTGPWWLRGPGEISGNTRGTGTLDWLGRVKFDGDVQVTKTLDVTAETRLRGRTTVEDDLRVTADGKIIVGDMTIDPSAGAGRVTFANGATVRAHDGGVTLMHGGSQVTVNGNRVFMLGGGAQFELRGGRYVFDPTSIPTITQTGLPAGCLFVDPNGVLARAG